MLTRGVATHSLGGERSGVACGRAVRPCKALLACASLGAAQAAAFSNRDLCRGRPAGTGRGAGLAGHKGRVNTQTRRAAAPRRGGPDQGCSSHKEVGASEITSDNKNVTVNAKVDIVGLNAVEQRNAAAPS